MNKQRYIELDRDGGKLTQEEMREGWHYCPEWDYMLTNYNDKEGETCSCEPWDVPPNNQVQRDAACGGSAGTQGSADDFRRKRWTYRK